MEKELGHTRWSWKELVKSRQEKGKLMEAALPKGKTFDTALPQDWLKRAAEVIYPIWRENIEERTMENTYLDILLTTVWIYPENEPFSVCEEIQKELWLNNDRFSD